MKNAFLLLLCYIHSVKLKLLYLCKSFIVKHICQAFLDLHLFPSGYQQTLCVRFFIAASVCLIAQYCKHNIKNATI